MPIQPLTEPSQTPQIWQAVAAGSLALHTLAGRTPAGLFGVTSRGLFLHVPPNRVVFLSPEPFRGPLTVNVPALPRLDLQPGDKAQVERGVVRFNAVMGEVHTGQAAAWLVEPQRGIPPKAGWQARLLELARRVLAEKSGHGLTALLADLVGLEHIPGSLPGGDEGLLAGARQAAHLLRHGQVQAAVVSLERFYGLGTGLTPSGDDLLLGLLLGLDRLRDAALPGQMVSELASQLSGEAYGHTTLLSANLIECAAGGQADERLVAALDFLWGDASDIALAAEGLCAWGNSSGADSLAGMSLALATISPDHPTVF
jgi:hypothetical protein